MKILVNGIYATRKTSFGNWLQSTHGIKHIDLEAISDAKREGVPAEIAFSREPLILTWGVPMEERAFQLVRAIAAAGAVPWWFDAPRALARQHYVTRSGAKAACDHFDVHLARLSKFQPLLDQIYGDRKIPVLTAAGFMDSAAIWQRIQGV
jgi:hypothetical protein